MDAVIGELIKLGAGGIIAALLLLTLLPIVIALWRIRESERTTHTVDNLNSVKELNDQGRENDRAIAQIERLQDKNGELKELVTELKAEVRQLTQERDECRQKLWHRPETQGAAS